MVSDLSVSPKKGKTKFMSNLRETVIKMEVEVYICGILQLSYETLGWPEILARRKREKPKTLAVTNLLHFSSEKRVVAVLQKRKNKTACSGNTQQRLFDCGGENHM